MHAARSAYPDSNVNLRQQLLSTDIGNIDVRDEIPIGQEQRPHQGQVYNQQYQQQQQQQQQRQQQQHPQQQQQHQPQQQQGFYQPQGRPMVIRQNGPGPYMGNVPQFMDSQQQLYQQPLMRPQVPQPPSPRSRKSSLTGNSPSFNILKMGKGRKGGNAGFDEDDDGKDYDIDPSAQDMSFDDLTTMRDRGRYGAHASKSDTAPIIPTLQSAASLPSGQVSNTQYRKQMFAMKKQAIAQAGKGAGGMLDPRAMSLQSMQNPYQQLNEPRMGSITSQSSPSMNAPRTNSMTNAPPLQPGMGPRAYSLTTNPYQQQQQMLQQQRRAPMNHMQPMQQRVPMHGHPQQMQGPQMQGLPMQQQKVKRLSVPTVSSPLSTGAYQGRLQGQYPQQTSQLPGQGPLQTPVQRVPVQHTPAQQVSIQHSSAQQATAQRAPVQQAPVQQPQVQQASTQQQSQKGQNHVQHIRQPQAREIGLSETGHQEERHFLADNVDMGDDSSLDDSRDKSQPLPNEESTPSPKAHGQDDVSYEPYESPSKITRSRGLPRLSLLSMRDDEDELEDAANGYFPRTLEPVDERSTGQNFTESTASTRQSPAKRLAAQQHQQQQQHKRGHSHSNGVSISSMSEYSTTSDYHPDRANEQKLYQLSQPSGTDVFVTASEFSLNRPLNLGEYPNSGVDSSNVGNTSAATSESTVRYLSGSAEITDTSLGKDADKITMGKTSESVPLGGIAASGARSKRNSTSSLASTQSRDTKSSLKNVLKSPKFFKSWTKKKTERKDSFELVTEPLTTPLTKDKSRYSNDEISTVDPERSLANEPLQNQSFDPRKKEHSNGSHQTSASPPYLNGRTPPLMNSQSTQPSPSLFQDNGPILGDQLTVPKAETKKLGLTVEQLGIMQENTSLMRELNLVSNELAASCQREIILEEKLQGTAGVSSPVGERDHDYASEIARLVQALNDERQKRYISEEHVLLMENGSKPSLLELSYDNENLRSELSMRDEVIAKQSAEINALEEETPSLKLQVARLTKSNKEMETTIIPKLKNQVEVLLNDNQKVRILSEKLKILRNQKMQLEKSQPERLQSDDGFSFVRRESPNREQAVPVATSSSPESTPRKFSNQKGTKASSPLRPPPSSSSPFRNSHAPPSFSLINVTASGLD